MATFGYSNMRGERTKQINISLTLYQLNVAGDEAKRQKITLSEYIRRMLDESMGLKPATTNNPVFNERENHESGNTETRIDRR